MSAHDKSMSRIREVQDRYTAQLLKKPQVIGVSIGRIGSRAGEDTGELALVVLVDPQTPGTALDPDDAIPTELEGIPVVVREVGSLKAL